MTRKTTIAALLLLFLAALPLTTQTVGYLQVTVAAEATTSSAAQIPRWARTFAFCADDDLGDGTATFLVSATADDELLPLRHRLNTAGTITAVATSIELVADECVAATDLGDDLAPWRWLALVLGTAQAAATPTTITIAMKG